MCPVQAFDTGRLVALATNGLQPWVERSRVAASGTHGTRHIGQRNRAAVAGTMPVMPRVCSWRGKMQLTTRGSLISPYTEMFLPPLRGSKSFFPLDRGFRLRLRRCAPPTAVVPLPLARLACPYRKSVYMSRTNIQRNGGTVSLCLSAIPMRLLWTTKHIKNNLMLMGRRRHTFPTAITHRLEACAPSENAVATTRRRHNLLTTSQGWGKRRTACRQDGRRECRLFQVRGLEATAL